MQTRDSKHNFMPVLNRRFFLVILKLRFVNPIWALKSCTKKMQTQTRSAPENALKKSSLKYLVIIRMVTHFKQLIILSTVCAKFAELEAHQSRCSVSNLLPPEHFWQLTCLQPHLDRNKKRRREFNKIQALSRNFQHNTQ